MRTVILIVCLVASARALAAPATTAKSCRISFASRKGFDVGCLPALSARGTILALPIVDPDGDRARPNLEVRFIPLDGRPVGSTIVLTVDEADVAGDALAQKVEPRLDLVNAQLSMAGFGALRTADAEGLELVTRSDAVEIRGGRIEAETVRLEPAAPCTGPAFVGGAWAASDGKAIVVRIDRTVIGACATPTAIYRALRVRTGKSVAGATAGGSGHAAEEASALNTRAMRKFRSKDWAAAGADFRAAIARFSDHVKARYNLACLASITKDRETALTQLRWLAASDLPEAARKIVKARTDPDLTFIRSDPEAQAILAAK